MFSDASKIAYVMYGWGMGKLLSSFLITDSPLNLTVLDLILISVLSIIVLKTSEAHDEKNIKEMIDERIQKTKS